MKRSSSVGIGGGGGGGHLPSNLSPRGSLPMKELTIRDYFIAQAMIGCLSCQSQDYDYIDDENGSAEKYMTEEAIAMADALLEKIG